MALVRFRADPKKIRVSLRCNTAGLWVAEIRKADSLSLLATGIALSPKAATEMALARTNYPGVHRSVPGIYEHPFGKDESHD